MTAAGPLINRAWQPLPGSARAEIYPYMRKPDLLSANACLIRTAEQILLVDPGAREEQTRDLAAVIRLCCQGQSLPVLTCLTHCHLDHCLQAPLIRQELCGAPAWIAVHEEGAQPLARGDEKRSLAEMYDIPFPPFSPDFLLMTRQDRELRAPRQIRLSPSLTVTLRTDRIGPSDGRPLYRQEIPIGDGELLYLYPAPGHSPDGLCLQVGAVLFIGDLLAAVNPFVAGIAGWSREDYLLTGERVLWLLDNAGITVCIPGHGGPLSAADTRESLRRLLQDARHLGELEEVNRERVQFTAEYAQELIDEAEEIFSAIAGRIGYVSYQLEAIEEPEAAADLRELMDMGGIDACLADFRRLCGEVEAGRLMKLGFVLASLRDLQKIKRLFDRRRLEAIIQPSLLNRVDRLLLDFVGVARGVRNPEEFVWTDLAQLLPQIIGELRATPRADSAFIDASERREDYLAALTARIGYADLFDKTLLEVSDTAPLPPVRLAAARFADTLTHLLEFLAVRGAGAIEIEAGGDRGSPVVRVSARGEPLAPGIDGQKGSSFARRFRMSGASSCTIAGNTVRICLTAADPSATRAAGPPPSANPRSTC